MPAEIRALNYLRGCTVSEGIQVRAFFAWQQRRAKFPPTQFFTDVRDCINTERVTGGVDESGLEQGQRAMKIAPFAPTCINIDTKNGKSDGRGG